MNTQPLYKTLAIFGVGLIGGSVSLALKAAGQTGVVLGVGRNQDALQEAVELGVITSAVTPQEAAREADVILLATPVGQFPEILRSIKPFLRPDVVITDAGSTKGDVAAAAREALGDLLPRFVPAHPIAGAEKSGVAAARAELFTGKNVVLTPLAETAPDALVKADALWRACGANVAHMSTETHDAIFAAVSHLPHVLAFALVAEIAYRPNAEQLFGFCAGGFRDFTRIAGSSPEMWRDISLHNRDALLQEMQAYQGRLSEIVEALERNDGAALEALFTCAREARSRWLVKN